MPELPDIEDYLFALDSRISGCRIVELVINNPFLLRTVEPNVDDVKGLKVVELRRIGKRLAIGLERNIWLVIHLMIAGRLAWRDGSVKKRRPNSLATFIFESGEFQTIVNG
jgi:formamidopyrimidine-DNA glycosylase